MTESRGHNMGRGDSMILTFDVPTETSQFLAHGGTSNVKAIESLLKMGQSL